MNRTETEKQTISVIGGTSPLGIDLVRFLAGEGVKVAASYRDVGRVASDIVLHSNVVAVSLDLTQPFVSDQLYCKTVVWLAHVGQGRFNSEEVAANLAALDAFLISPEIEDVEKFIFVSSGGSVYGTPEKLPITEAHKLTPLSSYGKAKAAMEQRLTMFSQDSGIDLAILRPGNIYGFSDPNNDVKGIVAAAIDAIKRDKKFPLIHAGKTIRDYIHVDDVIDAIILAAENKAKNIVWNVATGVGTSVAGIIEKISRASGRKLENIEHIKNYASDVESNILSIKRIKRESDWRPTISLDDGIDRIVATSFSE